MGKCAVSHVGIMCGNALCRMKIGKEGKIWKWKIGRIMCCVTCSNHGWQSRAHVCGWDMFVNVANMTRWINTNKSCVAEIRSCAWQNSCICVSWLVCSMRGVAYAEFTCSCICVTKLMLVGDRTRSMFWRVHSCVWQDLFSVRCVHSYAWHVTCSLWHKWRYHQHLDLCHVNVECIDTEIDTDTDIDADIDVDTDIDTDTNTDTDADT